MPTSAHETLSTAVCPWLEEPLGRLEAAHADGRLGHGWLLAGPRGVGKINLALTFARRLLEGAGGAVRLLGAREAAGAMSVRHEPADRHPDLHWVFPEPKRRTLSVEQIREAARALSLTSHTARSKVLVLESADTMTAAAANALLKTLEEPSADTYLLLLSHQPGRLPATIRSRCQSLWLDCPPVAATLAWLQAFADGPDDPGLEAPLNAANGIPFLAIDLIGSPLLSIYNELHSRIESISAGRADPQIVAEEWLSGDIEAALGWFADRLQTCIRIRLAPGSAVGQAGEASRLRDAWPRLSTRFLLQQLQNVELLIGQTGGGINIELAVRALLAGFQPAEGERDDFIRST